LVRIRTCLGSSISESWSSSSALKRLPSSPALLASAQLGSSHCLPLLVFLHLYVGGSLCGPPSFLLPSIGRLFTVNFLGKRSPNRILMGLIVSDQFCSVGKKGISFSGFHLSQMALLWIASGHFLSQLTCMWSLQDMQNVLALLEQDLVW